MTQRAWPFALLWMLGCGDDRTLGDTVAEAMDPSVDPCTDFYRYACGGWLSSHTSVRAPRFGRGFGELANRNFEVLLGILEETQDPNLSSYYGACLDVAAVDRAGLGAMAALFEAIDSVRDLESLMSVAGMLQTYGVSVPFDLSIGPSVHDPTRSILDVGQGGFGLPDRSFYLGERPLIADYQTYVGDMLALSGGTSTAARAVVELETALATTSTPSVALRAPENVDHEMDLASLFALAPLPWDAMFRELGPIDRVNVTTPDHLAALATLLANTTPETLRAYLRWRTLDAFASHFPSQFLSLQRAFEAKLYGPTPEQPRLRLCVISTNWALRDTLGRAFLQTIMPAEGFDLARSILSRVEGSFGESLGEAGWLDPQTRDRAIEKIGSVADKVGSPMPWPEIIDAEPGPDHLDNVLRFSRAKADRYFGKLGAPVDRSEWLISVPTVNAYYSPHLNEIVFPAAILQLPFFTGESLPLSFGGIGSVMGHELTHALDDEGRRFTSDGRLEEWWTQESIEEFDRRAECVVDQFGAHQIQPGLLVDGRLTLGENIADMGGIDLAHRAYVAWEIENGEPESLDGIDELDPVQLLFVAFAQTWCTVTTPETERLLAVTDVHSPPKLRVNGPLRNLPAFHEAFGCEVGSGMHPEAPCEVW